MRLIIALLFFVPSIVVGIFDVKKRKLEGLKKLTTFLIYLYFGISWCLIIFAPNIWVAMFLFLQWLVIIGFFNIKTNLFTGYILMIVGFIGMILSLLNILNFNIKSPWILWTLLGVSIYFIPLLAYFDRKRKIIRKIKHCTEEVDAKIIKIYKGSAEDNHYHLIYVPKFEFKLNDKTYKFMDSTEIYFKNKNLYSVGDSVKLFVSPNPKIDNPNGCDDVFFPNSYREHCYKRNTIIFYAVTLLVFLLIIILRAYA